MKLSRRDIGKLVERLARGFLEEQGFRILETNYRCPEGEIDIVAQHQDCLIFVEVRAKTRPNAEKAVKVRTAPPFPREGQLSLIDSQFLAKGPENSGGLRFVNGDFRFSRPPGRWTRRVRGHFSLGSCGRGIVGVQEDCFG